MDTEADVNESRRKRALAGAERALAASVRLQEATLDVYGSLGFTSMQGLDWSGLDDSNTGAWASIQPPLFQQSQKRGETLPVYLTEDQLRWLRDRSRILCFNNEFALCGSENRINYIVGDNGLKYTARPTKKLTGDKEAKRLAEQTQEFIDAFAEINELPEIEAEALRRGDEDGEYFLRLFPDSDGMSELRFIEPEHIRSPNGESWGPATSFGIQTPEDDIGHVEAYHVIENPLITGWTTTRVEERDIVHVKFNVKSSSKRGLPTYYPVETNLRRCEDLLASMSHMAKSRAKIALIRTLTGVTSDVAASLLSSLTEINVTDPATSANLNIERLRYGTVLTTGSNAKYEFPAGQIGAADYVEVLQAELRAVAARLQMSEWMFTCVADAKYSNAFVVEAPTLKAFKRIQTRFCRRFGSGRYGNKKSLVWRAIDFAIEAGMLPARVRECVEVDCKGPSLEARDKAQEASTNQVYHELGAKSLETIQEETGLDPETEAQRLAEEHAATRKAKLVQTVPFVQQIQTAFYAGQLPRPAAGALLAVLDYTLTECEDLLPLASGVNRQAQPAMPAGQSGGGNDSQPGGGQDEPPYDPTDPGWSSDATEPEEGDATGDSGGAGGAAPQPVREAAAYVEGDHPRAADGEWIAKNGPLITKAHVDNAHADAKAGNTARMQELRNVVHPEDRAKLEQHFRDAGLSGGQRVDNQRADKAKTLRDLGWAAGNKLVEHVGAHLDKIAAKGPQSSADEHEMMQEVYTIAGSGRLPELRNVMRSMGIQHKDFPKTKKEIEKRIIEKVKAAIYDTEAKYYAANHAGDPDFSTNPADHAEHAIHESAAAVGAALLQLREAGFTGQITDSLGRTYHYVDGVRVTSATDTTPHAEAHETPAEIAAMTGAHPDSGIGELATPIHDIMTKSAKQKKNHATVAERVARHVAGLPEADRAQLAQHFGDLTDVNKTSLNVNELKDKLKRHAKTPAAEPTESATPETPPPDAPAKPKTKAERKEIAGRFKGEIQAVRNHLAQTLGTREINDRMTPEQKAAEFKLFQLLEPLSTGREREGPHDLGEISPDRYSGYIRGAEQALAEFRKVAGMGKESVLPSTRQEDTVSPDAKPAETPEGSAMQATAEPVKPTETPAAPEPAKSAKPTHELTQAEYRDADEHVKAARKRIDDVQYGPKAPREKAEVRRDLSVRRANDEHREAVEAAVKAGKHVPEKVLADYPDLSPAKPAETPAAPTPAATTPEPAKPAEAAPAALSDNESHRRQELAALAPKSQQPGMFGESGSEHPELDALEDSAIRHGLLRDGEIIKGGSYEARSKALADLLTREHEARGSLPATLHKAWDTLTTHVQDREDEAEAKRGTDRAERAANYFDEERNAAQDKYKELAEPWISPTISPEDRAKVMQHVKDALYLHPDEMEKVGQSLSKAAKRAKSSSDPAVLKDAGYYIARLLISKARKRAEERAK